MFVPDIVVAGHICLDVIPSFGQVDREDLFRPGTLIEVGRPVMATGGAVSNVGLALHRLGLPVRLIGKVGDDLFGRAILDLLREHDAALADAMVVAPGDASSYTIVLSPPGIDRSFLHSPGANDTFHPTEVNRDSLPGALLLHFGYPPLMARTYADGGRALGELFSDARHRGVAVSLDMAQFDPASRAGDVDWPAFLRRVLPHVDIFGPSIGEILQMMGRRGKPDTGQLVEVAEQLLEWGPAVVMLKLGRDGLFMRTTSDLDRLERVPGVKLDERWRNRTVLHPCFDVQAIGTTGAGDCTLAGFLAALTKARGPEEALRDASAVGGCSVEREDATSGVPGWDSVQRRIHDGWPQQAVQMRLDGWSWSSDNRLWVGPRHLS